MKEYLAYTYYTIESLGATIKKSFTSVHGVILLLGTISYSWTGLQKALVALGIAIVIDFITGIVAAYIEHRKGKKEVKTSLDEPIEKSPYFFQSGKARLTIVKAVSYSFLIFFSYIFSILFFDKPINLIWSTKTPTLTEIVTGICIAIEVWSNIENFKRMGFDLVGTVGSIAKTGWELFRKVKQGK